MEGISVNPTQLRNEIELFKIEIGFKEREIFTLVEFGKQERTMWRGLASGNGVNVNGAEQYNLAHKAHESAVVEIKRLELNKLKAYLNIKLAMLEEVEKIEQGQAGSKLVIS